MSRGRNKDLAAVDGRRFSMDGIMTAVTVVLLLVVVVGNLREFFSHLCYFDFVLVFLYCKETENSFKLFVLKNFRHHVNCLVAKRFCVKYCFKI